jgi:hypothetical protein
VKERRRRDGLRRDKFDMPLQRHFEEVFGPAFRDQANAMPQRYSYQFYVAPLNETLSALIKSLPADRRVRWRSKPESGDMS